MAFPRSLKLAAGLLFAAETGCLSLSDPTADGRDAGTSTGAQSGTGGSVATGGSFPGSGGGGAGTENCLNGVDDDGDSLIDCADPDCTPDFECVDVPSNWSPVLLNTTTWSSSPAAPAPCASGTPTRYFQGPAGAAACDACSCGALTGNCGDTPISCVFGNTTCSGVTAFSVTTCSNFQAPVNKQISCSIGTTPLGGGACLPSTAALTNPDPWQNVADACPLVAGGCAAGTVCVPKNAASHSVCIEKAQTSGCPYTWPTKDQVYTGGSDTRACSACGCDTSALACDADTFNFMTMADCIDFGPYPTFFGTCQGYTSTSTSTTWSIQRVPAASKAPSGSCTPSGGVASGVLTTEGKTTLCCR